MRMRLFSLLLPYLPPTFTEKPILSIATLQSKLFGQINAMHKKMAKKTYAMLMIVGADFDEILRL